MSYTPTTWAAGDTVTAAKLNKIEQGVAAASGVLVVHIALNDDYWVCDKTASEIWTATQSGIVLFMFGDSTEGTIYSLKSAANDAGYSFGFGDSYIATATNGTDYPKYAD